MAKASKNTGIIAPSEQALLTELSQLIEQSRKMLYKKANSAIIMFFWNIGNRINKEILQNKRADYGKRIVSTLSTQLKDKYGKKFELRNVQRMIQFAEQFTDIKIVSTLSTQLSWSHFVTLLPIKSQEAKLYYAQASAAQVLGIRDLRKQISAKTFERSSIANLQNTSNHPFVAFMVNGTQLQVRFQRPERTLYFSYRVINIPQSLFLFDRQAGADKIHLRQLLGERMPLRILLII